MNLCRRRKVRASVDAQNSAKTARRQAKPAPNGRPPKGGTPNPKPKPKKVVGKPFEKGKSGNPGGRPRTRPYIEEIKKFLDENNGEMFRALLINLIESKPEILLYYVAGKPIERLEHSGSVVAGLPDDYLQLLRDHGRKL